MPHHAHSLTLCKPPKYTHHVPSGQARVRLRGKDYYLGLHGSPESYRRYAEFLARLEAGELPSKLERTQKAALPCVLSIAELIERVLEIDLQGVLPSRRRADWRTGHFPIGPSSPPAKVRHDPRGRVHAEAAQGSPRSNDRPGTWSKAHISTRRSVGSGRRVQLGGREELISAAVAGALATVKGIREGRTAAREKPEAGPVADEVVEATLPRVSPVAADVIRIMRLSGARPAEAVGMKVEEIDRTDPDCWRYAPRRHKTSHRGKKRVVFLGPKCQAVLNRYILKAGSSGKIFPITHSGLRTAITRGCRRAGVGHWAPNQLRHAHATTVRREFGVEASQVMLGHSHINTTEIYAEANAERGREVARKLG